MIKLFLVVAAVSGANPTQPLEVGSFSSMKSCEEAAENTKYLKFGAGDVSRFYLCVPSPPK